jgi:hypothetical protein
LIGTTMRRNFGIGLACVALFALASCGGGSASSDATDRLPTAQLSAQITEFGTYLECKSSAGLQIRLERTRPSGRSSETIPCPDARILTADFDMSIWNAYYVVAGNSHLLATTRTLLPRARVISDGVHVSVKHPLANSSLSLQLQALASDGSVLGTFADASQVPSGYVTTAPVVTWRWAVSRDAVEYVSEPTHTISFKEIDLGFWGALSVGDLGNGEDTLLGDGSLLSGETSARYDALGLGALLVGRDFRDVRIVDLDNDGTNDIVSNVYGTGCLLIAMHQAQGGYDMHTPLLADGSCISGNGETLLVADFDGDGLVDIFVPTYQGWTLLHNRGRGQFDDVSQESGIGYVAYDPHAEGAAAVDINLDGTVDIVAGSEVLLNDGRAHFSRLPQPFGRTAVFDEGMSVADIDNDGVFDIVKTDPNFGPRVFWGNGDRNTFNDDGWIVAATTANGPSSGPVAAFQRSYGITVGDFSGGGLADIVVAGGDPTGRPPVLCAQIAARSFDCLEQAFAFHDGAWQDLLLATDLNGDGAVDLVARYGTLRTYVNQGKRANVFRFDLRDAAGRRNQHGRTLRARCAGTGALVGLKFVDGGNGYMAQGNYVVPFTSPWCSSVTLEIPSAGGMRTFGPFGPGTTVVRLSAS